MTPHPASLAVLAAALTLPCAARADVLEVSGGAYGWVVGGPPGAPAVADPADDAADDAGAVPGTAHPLSLTEASELAGPTQWSGRVGQLAAKYDISPALLEAVVWQESRWNPAARSPVGAQGLAQLMPGTARQLGVNPRDPGANLEGGARYLRLQLDAFDGDVERALAAYNAGPARVLRAGGIPAIAETRAYVAAIMARLSAPVRR